MKKNIGALLYVSIGLDVLYLFIISVVCLLPLLPAYQMRVGIHDAQGLCVPIVSLVMALLSIIAKVVMAILIVPHTDDGFSSVAPEVMSLILLCGVATIITTLINVVYSRVLATGFGASSFAMYCSLNNTLSIFAFIHTISNALFIFGSGMSLANKKHLKIQMREQQKTDW